MFSEDPRLWDCETDEDRNPVKLVLLDASEMRPESGQTVEWLLDTVVESSLVLMVRSPETRTEDTSVPGRVEESLSAAIERCLLEPCQVTIMSCSDSALERTPKGRRVASRGPPPVCRGSPHVRRCR